MLSRARRRTGQFRRTESAPVPLPTTLTGLWIGVFFNQDTEELTMALDVSPEQTYVLSRDPNIAWRILNRYTKSVTVAQTIIDLAMGFGASQWVFADNRVLIFKKPTPTKPKLEWPDAEDSPRKTPYFPAG